MAQYTTPHSLPVIEPTVDRIKDTSVPAALARDINALATATNAAISKEGGRAESAAKTAAAADATNKANAAKAAAVEETKAKAAQQDVRLDNHETRVKAIEVIGRLAPGDISDATMTDILANPETNAAKEMNGRFVRKGELVTNVADFLWLGDGKAAIEAAVAAARPGGTVFLPAGVYASTSTDWVEITKPLTMQAEPGTVIKGIRFYVHGSAEELRPIEVGAKSGDKNVRVSGHGLKVNDFVQLFSEYNVYTPDAGRFQMGSVNPTTGKLWTCRATEIQRVGHVSTPDQIRALATLRYNYGSNIQNLTQPMAGVSSAEIRKLNMVEDVIFRGIHFDLSEVAGTTPILFRFAASPRFERCSFQCSGPIGGYVQATDSYDLQFIDSWMCHPIQGAPVGSGQNAVLIGAGCTEVTFDNSSFYGGAQVIDTITNTLFSSGQPGAQGDIIKSELATVQDVKVVNCRFYDAVDAFTSHPATYGVELLDNVIIGGSMGLHPRSRKTVIRGNTIRTSLIGIGASAFFDDSVIEDNEIEQLVSSVERPHAWTGIQYTPTSVETMTGNRAQRLRIQRNTITASDTTTGHVGVKLYHSNREYAGLTDQIKWAQSDIIVADNDFTRCGVKVDDWINGAQILRNNFKGGAQLSHYVYMQDQAARTTVEGNTFNLDAGTGGFRLGTPSGARGYDMSAIIGNNTYFGTGPANVTTSPIIAGRSAGGLGNAQSGATNVTLSGDAVGAVKSTTVTFPQPFINPPAVVAMSQATSTTVKYVSQVTTTSFQITAEKVAASGFNASASWIAVGQIA